MKHLGMEIMNILVVVDYQNDFNIGGLVVPGATKIKEKIQELINDRYHKVIYTFDSHTEQQYNNSAEKILFPKIHCTFGNYEQWLLYDIHPRNQFSFHRMINNMQYPDSFEIGDEIFCMKHTFDIWDGMWSGEGKSFLDYVNHWKDSAITICGVAGDYCVHDNIMGFVKNGFTNITVVENAIASINQANFEKQKLQFKQRGVKYINL